MLFMFFILRDRFIHLVYLFSQYVYSSLSNTHICVWLVCGWLKLKSSCWWGSLWSELHWYKRNFLPLLWSALSQVKKNIQNLKCHSTPLSILHYFHYSSVKPTHGFMFWLNQFIFELAPKLKHTPVRTQQLPSLSHFFLPFIQYFLSYFYSLYLFLWLSLFPSPLSFLVIPLNHCKGPSLFVGLSHPSMRPRLPSIFLLSRSLSQARLSTSSLSISEVEN